MASFLCEAAIEVSVHVSALASACLWFFSQIGFFFFPPIINLFFFALFKMATPSRPFIILFCSLRLAALSQSLVTFCLLAFNRGTMTAAPNELWLCERACVWICHDIVFLLLLNLFCPLVLSGSPLLLFYCFFVFNNYDISFPPSSHQSRKYV